MEKVDHGDGSGIVLALIARGQALHEELRTWGGPGTARLQKLVRAELSFLNRLAAFPLLAPALSCPALRSSNFDHLEDVFRILQHPVVNGISSVMQNVAVGDPDTSTPWESPSPISKSTAHVDIACMLDGKPVWVIVSSRNPRYICWLDTGNHTKGLKSRLLLLLHAGCADAVKQPRSIFLCFSGRVPEDVDLGLREDFRAIHVPSVHQQPSLGSSSRDFRRAGHLDNPLRECKLSEVEGGEWLDVEVQKDATRWNLAWETYEVIFDYLNEGTQVEGLAGQRTEAAQTVASDGELARESDSGICPLSLLSRRAFDQQTSIERSVQLALDQTEEQPAADLGQKLLNLDTTALIALVSEVSNGGAEYLLALPHGDLEKRFPSMSAFIREQAISELEKPLAPEIEEAMACHQVIASQYVYDEFLSIVSQIGGAKERNRAKKLLNRIRVVPDMPSNRVMSLACSGRVKQRHKTVFGTGDFLNAPTLTANMAFVRATRVKGMSIAIVEHRPRALTGD